MAQWWTSNRAGDNDSASVTSTSGPHLRSLGVICELQSEYAEYYELEFLHLMRDYATDLWPSLSGGHDADCLDMTRRLYVALELDEKAIMDLMLLAQSGEVGRAEYNHVMWKLITEVAIEPPYRDLNRKVSQMVLNARTHFDRPPAQEWGERKAWGWASLMKPRFWDWSPCAVPVEYLNGDKMVLTGSGGMPLEPPWCYEKELRLPLPPLHMFGPQNLDLKRDPRPSEEKQKRDDPRERGHQEGWRSRVHHGGSSSSGAK